MLYPLSYRGGGPAADVVGRLEDQLRTGSAPMIDRVRGASGGRWCGRAKRSP